MRVEDVQEHINSHEIVVNMSKTPSGKVLSSPDFLINEVLSMLESMKNVFEVVKTREIDASTVKQLKDLHDAIANDIKTLAELQGRLKTTGDMETKIVRIQNNLNIIIDMVDGGELCSVCESKLKRRIDDLQRLLGE